MATQWHPTLMRFNNLLESHQGHIAVLLLVLLDLAFVYTELLLLIIACETNSPHLVNYAGYLGWVSVGFFCFFLVENLVRMTLQGRTYFASFWNVFDFTTIVGSLVVELILGRIYSAAVAFLIVLRFWRIFRVAHAATDAANLLHQDEIKRLSEKIRDLEHRRGVEP